jgi:carbon-monoxide dehydrogenase small subunit
MILRFQVNAQPAEVDVLPMKRLLDTLREDLRLTGTKEGCGEGECGACTVLIDGRAVNSCLVPTLQVEGAQVTTVEGLASGDAMHAVQQAFLAHGGAQCGICTPGFLVAAAELLERDARPSRLAVREALAGNLCRCTGYQKIVDAVANALGHEGA